MLCRMKSPQTPVALPLEYASELAMELHMMRGECCAVAQDLAEQRPNDEVGLQECVLLDDALREANLLLCRALAAVRISRVKRGRQGI